MNRARTYHCTRMRHCIEQSNGLVPSLLCPSWVDCIIATRGYDFRKGQLVDLRPNAIFGVTTPAIGALARATKTIPIVFAGVSDPVGAGYFGAFASGRKTGEAFSSIAKYAQQS